MNPCTSNVTGNHVLVTGGTGSFGHKVATVLAKEAASVTIFSRDEKKQHDMRAKWPDFKYIVGDVRDYEALRQAYRKVDIVFHAAALKQVPSCEHFPREALLTNCHGILNSCNAANENGVKRLVVLSTDKAVLPINSMGISKAMGEKIVAAQQGDTICSVVRYGNILGSRGSVLPFWIKQLKENKQITITDPKMTRFLMNLEESVSLVQFALQNATGGEVFVHKAKALNMLDFYEHFASYAKCTGLAPKIVGRRPGEKMHETLVCEDELYRSFETQGYVTIYPFDEAPKETQLKAPLTSDTAPYPSDMHYMLCKAEEDMEAEL